ncbi:MAG: Spy/CpxP family protein refolding chaperone [Alphaproteobacteria bacterium]|nr:Spy/CpxP family protein refolding chaperone [Alphaproteobacteria bacterium]
MAYTEVRIGITDQQKSAWQTFSQDVKAAMAPMQKLCTERAAMPRPTTPPDAATQLGEREKMLTAMLETTKGLRLAVEKLTPSLTDDQKKQVAEIVGRMGRGPGDRGMRGDRMMHRHDHGPGFGPGRGPMSPINTPPSGPPR